MLYFEYLNSIENRDTVKLRILQSVLSETENELFSQLNLFFLETRPPDSAGVPFSYSAPSSLQKWIIAVVTRTANNHYVLHIFHFQNFIVSCDLQFLSHWNCSEFNFKNHLTVQNLCSFINHDLWSCQMIIWSSLTLNCIRIYQS